MSQEQLHEEIIARSEATTWALARQEWGLKNIWMSDTAQTCLCGPHPIKEICEIENQVNGATTEVGNCCVNHFLGMNSEQFFTSVRKVRADGEASFNEATIEFAHGLGIITDWERGFYLDIWRKRVLSPKQLNRKRQINEKMMKHFLR